MKLGIVADIHSNYAGLAEALRLLDATGIDDLIVAGDAIYEYKFSDQVVEELRRRDAKVVLGNHEEGYFLTAEGKALSGQESHQWLRKRPHEIDTELDGHRLLIFHSTPWQPRGEYLTPQHKRFRELGTLGYDIIIHGHTHWQYAGMVGKTLVINPGSAGEPRDHRNGLRGSAAVLDTISLEVNHIDFDVPRLRTSA